MTGVPYWYQWEQTKQQKLLSVQCSCSLSPFHSPLQKQKLKFKPPKWAKVDSIHIIFWMKLKMYSSSKYQSTVHSVLQMVMTQGHEYNKQKHKKHPTKVKKNTPSVLIYPQLKQKKEKKRKFPLMTGRGLATIWQQRKLWSIVWVWLNSGSGWSSRKWSHPGSGKEVKRSVWLTETDRLANRKPSWLKIRASQCSLKDVLQSVPLCAF